MRRANIVMGVVLLLAAGAAMAATTGRLTGVVEDNNGVALPGVTAIISSDVLIGGQQVAVTGVDGEFVFNLLPPGVYNVKLDLPGFQPVELEAKVSLDRTTTVRAQMVEVQFAEEIQVTATAPVVDTTQVDSSTTFDQAYLENAAVGAGGRDYLSVIGNAAGVAGSGNVNVFGSLGSENAYLIDGLNTTDPVTATFGTNFNFDAIQEVNILTGGYEAEFGQATGGVVNLVTKSGGNELSGTLDIRYRDNSMYESGDHYDPDRMESSFEDYSATLGGPFLRDKLWFFASGEYVLTKSTPPYSNVGDFQPNTRTYDGWNYIAKLTWQVAPSHRAIVKYSGDPATIDNSDAGTYTSPEADSYQKQGGDIYQAELNSVLSDSALLTAQVGINRGYIEVGPMSGDLDTPAFFDAWTGVGYDNYVNYQQSDRDRDQARASFSYFLDDFAGAHELKAGFEYNDISFASRNFITGERYYGVLPPDGAPDYYPFYDYDGDGLTDWYMYVDYPLETARDEVDSTGEMWTGFLQDNWRPFPSLTVKPGVRWETISYVNTVGEDVATLDRWQPRFGVAWDVRGDGKTVLRGSWGRFMHPSALGLPDTYSGVVEGTEEWYGYEYLCASTGICNLALLERAYGEPYVYVDEMGHEHLYFFQELFGGGEPNRTIEQLGLGDLEAPYADELIVGFEQQILDNTSFELSYVDKKTRGLFGDTCLNNTWMLFGEGVPFDYDDPSTWTNANQCADFAVANISYMVRDYEAIMFKFESRETDWMHLMLSYTWSESEGSSDEDASGGYDEPDFDVFPLTFYNKYGYMADHREHRVKLSGYLLLPWDVTVGLDGWWSSAGVYTVTADCATVLAASDAALDAAGITDEMFSYCQHGERWNTDIFVTPRGGADGEDSYGLDLQLSKGFQVGKVNLEAIVAVLNVFSTEIPAAFASDAMAATPLGTELAWTTPRRYEVGFRLEF